MPDKRQFERDLAALIWDHLGEPKSADDYVWILDVLEAAGDRLAEEADRRFPADESTRTELDAELRAWMMRHK
jgi:hypothetical protein